MFNWLRRLLRIKQKGGFVSRSALYDLEHPPPPLHHVNIITIAPDIDPKEVAKTLRAALKEEMKRRNL